MLENNRPVAGLGRKASLTAVLRWTFARSFTRAESRNGVFDFKVGVVFDGQRWRYSLRENVTDNNGVASSLSVWTKQISRADSVSAAEQSAKLRSFPTCLFQSQGALHNESERCASHDGMGSNSMAAEPKTRDATRSSPGERRPKTSEVRVQIPAKRQTLPSFNLSPVPVLDFDMNCNSASKHEVAESGMTTRRRWKSDKVQVKARESTKERRPDTDRDSRGG